MFIRCRQICASRERWEKHPPRYSKHRPRYSKHRPRYSDNGRDRPLLGTPSSIGRLRLNIEQRTVASNRSGLVKQLPRTHSTGASKVLDSELPETVEDSLLCAVPVSSRRTLMEVGDRTRVSGVFRTCRSTGTYRRDVDVFGTRILVRLLHGLISDCNIMTFLLRTKGTGLMKLD